MGNERNDEQPDFGRDYFIGMRFNNCRRRHRGGRSDLERTPHAGLIMRLRYVLGAVLISGIALLDLFIKRVVADSFKLGESIEVIPGFFSLTYILNPGAAFGLFSSLDSSIRIPLLLTFSILALGFIAYLYLGPLGRRKLPAVGLPLIAGGAIANLYERMTAGAVVDYLDFYVKGYHWPAFNVADASITVGVALFLIDSLIDSAAATKAPVGIADKGALKKSNERR